MKIQNKILVPAVFIIVLFLGSFADAKPGESQDQTSQIKVSFSPISTSNSTLAPPSQSRVSPLKAVER